MRYRVLLAVARPAEFLPLSWARLFELEASANSKAIQFAFREAATAEAVAFVVQTWDVGTVGRWRVIHFMVTGEAAESAFANLHGLAMERMSAEIAALEAAKEAPSPSPKIGLPSPQHWRQMRAAERNRNGLDGLK